MTTLTIGAVRLTRVGYAEVELPAETFGLTGDPLGAAAAAWIIESGDARIVVDPALAADDILRNDNDAAAHQEAFAAALADAGFARETITHAVATHYDGIGMLAWRNDDGSWAPFFPNAPVLYSAREDVAEIGHYLDEGDLHRTAEREAITDEMWLEHTGVHSAGHQIVRIESDGERAVIIVHLALVPMNLAVPGVNARAEFDRVTSIRDEGSLLVGPLWPTPGAGRWDGERLIPV
jgi:glyoxylase-like metal-dependent hydrolase (beta-lactamase superfamily II)